MAAAKRRQPPWNALSEYLYNQIANEVVIRGAAPHMMKMPGILATHSARPHTAASIERWDCDGSTAEFSQDKADAALELGPSVEMEKASARPKRYDPLAAEEVMGFIGADEAALWQDADVADFMGTTSIERGVYHVSILHNDEGEEDGALLRRRDVPGRMISLSQDQYAMLEDLPFFERR